MSQVLIVSSSFKKNGNSSTLAKHIAKGAKQAGHAVQTINIGGLDIKECRGCMGCMQPNVPNCVIQDDMTQFYPMLQQADIMIFASPIYWFNYCGQLKQFIDRCFAVAVSKPGQDHGAFHGKKFGVAFTYGDEEPFAAGAVNAIRSFQDMTAYCNGTWAGAIYGSAYAEGDILKNPALLDAAEKFGAKL